MAYYSEITLAPGYGSGIGHETPAGQRLDGILKELSGGDPAYKESVKSEPIRAQNQDTGAAVLQPSSGTPNSAHEAAVDMQTQKEAQKMLYVVKRLEHEAWEKGPLGGDVKPSTIEGFKEEYQQLLSKDVQDPVKYEEARHQFVKDVNFNRSVEAGVDAEIKPTETRKQFDVVALKQLEKEPDLEKASKVAANPEKNRHNEIEQKITAEITAKGGKDLSSEDRTQISGNIRDNAYNKIERISKSLEGAKDILANNIGKLEEASGVSIQYQSAQRAMDTSSKGAARN